MGSLAVEVGTVSVPGQQTQRRTFAASARAVLVAGARYMLAPTSEGGHLGDLDGAVARAGFNDIAQVDRDSYLPELIAFWARALLGIGGGVVRSVRVEYSPTIR